jgi:hypothetical protein
MGWNVGDWEIRVRTADGRVRRVQPRKIVEQERPVPVGRRELDRGSRRHPVA